MNGEQRMIDEARSFALGLAKEAGDIIRQNFALGTEKSWKADNSPLTTTDLAVNDLVLRSIKERFPEHAVIGEEDSMGDTVGSEWIWVCDPIDGTVPFSHGYPTFAFSIGLCHFGESVLGVIYDPMLDRLMVGQKGEGTTLNDVPVSVSNVDDLQAVVIDLECPDTFLFEGSQTRVALKQDGALVVSLFSVVYGGMLVGCGELAAAVYAHDAPWDGCAVDIVVREAGGVVTDLHGGPLRFNGAINGFVASNGGVHQAVLDAIAREYPPD